MWCCGMHSLSQQVERFPFGEYWKALAYLVGIETQMSIYFWGEGKGGKYSSYKGGLRKHPPIFYKFEVRLILQTDIFISSNRFTIVLDSVFVLQLLLPHLKINQRKH